MCCLLDSKHQRVLALYSDRLFFIWDIAKFDKMKVYRTQMSHLGPVHDIQPISNALPIGIAEP